MALATIINAAVANNAGTPATLSGPCSIGWRGDIGNMDGILIVSISLDGTNYVPFKRIDKHTKQEPIYIGQPGSYKVNVALEQQTLTPSTGITVVSLQ